MIRDVCLLFVFVSAALAQGVKGRVLEDHSGTPLASVEVRVQNVGAARLFADIETDAGGAFQLPAMPAGDYRFEFYKSNYLRATLVFKGSVPASMAVRLVRCGVISGRVLDQQGRPVRGAVVYALPKPAGGGPLRPVISNTGGSYALTGQDGQYRLIYLPPGEYAVAASYGASSMVLGMTGSSSVNPAVGSGVALYPDSARPEFLTVAGGEEYRDINLNVPPSTRYSVSGKVDVPSGTPDYSRFWLTLTPVERPSLAAAAIAAERQGDFRFEGIAAGSYYLLASGPTSARNSRGAALPSEPYFARSRVEVVAQNVEGLTVSPQKGVAMSFVLKAAPEAKGACPQSAHLTLTSMEDWNAVLDRTVTVTAKPQALANLAPARYDATLDDLGAICFQASKVTADLSGGAETIEIPVNAAGAIRGKLTGSENPSGFAVALLSADAMAGERTVLAALPDGEGRFAFEGLRPGRYYVAAQAAGASSSARWISDPARMLQIDISGGSYTELELPALAGGEKK